MSLPHEKPAGVSTGAVLTLSLQGSPTPAPTGTNVAGKAQESPEAVKNLPIVSDSPVVTKASQPVVSPEKHDTEKGAALTRTDQADPGTKDAGKAATQTGLEDGQAISRPPEASTAGPSDESVSNSNGVRFVRRLHLQFDNEKSEAEFLQLFRGKERVLQDLMVTKRLSDEKQAELADCNQTLIDQFSINPRGNYHYDDKTRIIYELLSDDAAVEMAGSDTNDIALTMQAQAAQKRVHLQLKDDGAARKFMRLAALKKLTMDEIQFLQLIIREKEIELARFDLALRDKFYISRDRDYQYDAATKTLFELAPMLPVKGDFEQRNSLGTTERKDQGK